MVLSRHRHPLQITNKLILLVALICYYYHHHETPYVRAAFPPYEGLIKQEKAKPGVESFFGDESSSSLVGIPPASQECWLDAIKALSYLGHELHDGTESSSPHTTMKSRHSVGVDPTTAGCTWMTPDHQKLLALQLSGCHLNDLGRSLFLKDPTEITPETMASCPASGGQSPDLHLVTLESMPFCLQILSDAGVNAYTHFFSYVNQLCTRLLQEAMVGHYYEATYQFAKSSQLAQERVNAVVQKHESLWETWNERQAQIVRLQESFQEDLQGEQERWFRHQSDLQRNHTKELESQQLRLENLSEAITKTNQSMKPWMAVVEWLFIVASQNFTPALSGLLSACGNIILIFLFTLPRRFRWIRKYLYGIVLIVILLECLLPQVGASNGFVFFGTKVKTDWINRAEWVSMLRNGAQVLEGLVLAWSLLTSCCRHPDEAAERPLNQPQDASILRRLELCEAEWNGILQRQRMEQQSPVLPIKRIDYSQGSRAEDPASNLSLSQSRSIETPKPHQRFDSSLIAEDQGHDDLFYETFTDEKALQPKGIPVSVDHNQNWRQHNTQTPESLSAEYNRALSPSYIHQSSSPIQWPGTSGAQNVPDWQGRTDVDAFRTRTPSMLGKRHISFISLGDFGTPMRCAERNPAANQQAHRPPKRSRGEHKSERPTNKESPTIEI